MVDADEEVDADNEHMTAEERKREKETKTAKEIQKVFQNIYDMEEKRIDRKVR